MDNSLCFFKPDLFLKVKYFCFVKGNGEFSIENHSELYLSLFL